MTYLKQIIILINQLIKLKINIQMEGCILSMFQDIVKPRKRSDKISSKKSLEDNKDSTKN